MKRNSITVVAAFIAAALLPCVTTVARAESAPPMTLQDAVSYALSHSPAVAQKVAAVGSALNALGKERLQALPTVNGELENYSQKSSNYNAYAIIPGIQQAQVYSQNTAEVITNYNFQSGGLAFLQLAATNAQLAQAREDLGNTEDQIATNVTDAFYAVVQKNAIVTVDQSDLDYQNHLVDDAKVKEHAGVAAGVDVLKAEVNQAKSNSTLVGAQTDVVNARESLAQTIGAPLDTAFAFPEQIHNPPLPNGSMDKLERIALHARPDVASAQDALAAARDTRKGFNRELFPSVQLTAAFGNQLSPTSINYVYNSQFQVIGELPRTGSPGFWNLQATSTFTLPFVDYGARHFERVNDDAQVDAAQATLDQTDTQVRIDVRSSYRSAQTALVQLGYASDEARLGTESARIARLQYQNGLIALSDVIQTQQQSVVAQSDYINAKVQYVEAVVKLRVSLGIFDARSAVADLR